MGNVNRRKFRQQLKAATFVLVHVAAGSLSCETHLDPTLLPKVSAVDETFPATTVEAQPEPTTVEAQPEPMVEEQPEPTTMEAQPEPTTVEQTEPTNAQPEPTEMPTSSFSDAGSWQGFVPLPPCLSAQGPQSEYLMCLTALDFSAASLDCAARGGTMVQINEPDENRFVQMQANSAMAASVWIGASRDDAFVWSWQNGAVFWRGEEDGVAEPGVFVVWHMNEPNNDSNVSTDPERCLAMTVSASDWNDRACSLALPYLCERPLPVP